MSLRLVFTALLMLSLMGCDSLRYYSQAASGQLSLMRGRQAISHVIADPNTPVLLRSQLQLVLQLRAFAERELQLPVDGQYSHYVDLHRPSVVWNVFAAPELSLESKTWCYPIAGCSAYRGYFKEQSAHKYAEELSTQGYDTYVGGVAAYSTLGWLDDPVLNTFVYRDEAQLADLLFHELAHKLLYIPGDTLFNESFATTVAGEGVRRWMIERDDPERYLRYLESRKQQTEFVQLLGRHRDQLQSVYISSTSQEKKRGMKRSQFDRLREEYTDLWQRWPNSKAYSSWVAAPMNNAKLNSVAMYFDLVPALQSLLLEEGRQLPGFYQRCKELAGLSPDQRRKELESAPSTH